MNNEVHIRSCSTGRYWNASGAWTALRRQARKFSTITEARDCCVQEHLVNIEIVVLRGELMCMRVPFNEAG